MAVDSFFGHAEDFRSLLQIVNILLRPSCRLMCCCCYLEEEESVCDGRRIEHTSSVSEIVTTGTELLGFRQSQEVQVLKIMNVQRFYRRKSPQRSARRYPNLTQERRRLGYFPSLGKPLSNLYRVNERRNPRRAQWRKNDNTAIPIPTATLRRIGYADDIHHRWRHLEGPCRKHRRVATACVHR